MEYTLLTKDGREFPGELSACVIKDSSGKVTAFVAITRDISERKQIEESLQRTNRALKTLSHCNEILVRANNESELLQRICRVIVEIGGYRIAWVGLAEEDEKKNVRPVAQTGFENGYLEALRITWADTELGHNPIGTALRTARPCISQDVLSDPGCTRWHDEATKYGYLSLIALPLITDKEPFGSLNIYANEKNAFDGEEIKLLTELTYDMAYGITALRTRGRHDKAKQELQYSLEKLKRILEQTVNALSSTLSKRDPYTASHQQRVTQLACAIAKKMGVSQQMIDCIRIAGLLHDIGKIHVPAEILSKPAALTNAEYEIVKTHPQVACDILKDIEFPWPIAEIALQHHERINGSGYPRRLREEEILLEAKILMVADVVEAMASHRPYRPSRGIEAALDEISKNRGVLYELQVVDACLKLFADKKFKFD